MNDYELNNRRLRVNFSNSSHLEVLAGKLGMDLSQQSQRHTTAGASQPAASSAGTNAVADALNELSKAEMYDIVAKLKDINERDPDEARRVLSSHPQLPEAILFLMSKLDMVKTPLSADLTAPMGPVAPPRAADPRARVDPRQASVATTTAAAPVAQPPRIDPRQQRVDPRQAVRTAPAPLAPTGPPTLYSVGAASGHASTGQTSSAAGPAHLDPSLVQQVMSLTPQQIQQLPPDKRQSILQLRQQITGSST
jgi:cleavage stimulation factor subunit 2